MLLTATIGLSSCIKDTYLGDNASDDTTIVLNLMMSNSTSSRAIEIADENTIHEVNVLSLIENASGKWVYEYTPQVISQSVNTDKILTIKARVRGMSVKQQFVVLANSAAELTNAAPEPGEDIDVLEERLICKTGNGVWPALTSNTGQFVAFPMYARTTGYLIEEKTNEVIGIYPMIRMVARIDVSLHSSLTDFNLTDAYVFNYKTEGYVSYFNSGFDASLLPPRVTWPGVPETDDNNGSSILNSEAYKAEDNAIIRSIYIFESDAITDESDMEKKTALVIGGYILEPPSRVSSIIKPLDPIYYYYRIDLKTDDDASENISSGILRNHLYNVVVKEVAGIGYDTPEEAYKGGKRLTATITKWNCADQNVILDKQYSLIVDKDELSFGADGGQMDIVATTDYSRTDQGYLSGIQIDEAEIVYKPAVSSENRWLTLSDVSGTNDDLVRTIGFVAADNFNGAQRSAEVYIKAGNLKKKISITQETGTITPEVTSNCYLLQPNGKGIYIPVRRANEHATGSIASGAVLTAELIWTDNVNGIRSNSNISSVRAVGTGSDGYVYVRPGSAEGNAMVAVKVGGVIKWSWHIWVTNATLSSMNTGQLLDRNLGAFSNNGNDEENLLKSFGLLYQYGRKDPFPGSANVVVDNTVEQPVYNENGEQVSIFKEQVAVSNNMENSILNPTTFYFSNSGIEDWYTNGSSISTQHSSLWNDGSSTKTIYDPCPYGWKVSTSGMWGDACSGLSGIMAAGWSDWNFGYSYSSRGGWYPATGSRMIRTGNLENVGKTGHVWINVIKPGADVIDLYYGIKNTNSENEDYFIHTFSYTKRASGFPVRCIVQ